MIYFVLETLALEDAAAEFLHDPNMVALVQERRDQMSNGLQ
jgi:hypothetical protein